MAARRRLDCAGARARRAVGRRRSRHVRGAWRQKSAHYAMRAIWLVLFTFADLLQADQFRKTDLQRCEAQSTRPAEARALHVHSSRFRV